MDDISGKKVTELKSGFGNFFSIRKHEGYLSRNQKTGKTKQ